MPIQPLRWEKDRLLLLDQRYLPEKTVWLECTSWEQVADAIKTMAVRGAPLIGVTAAYGYSLAKLKNQNLDEAYEGLKNTRPTAINLLHALNRVKKVVDPLSEAKKIEQEEIEANEKIGQHGASLIKEKGCVMTICNTGSLATPGIGTALGVIRTAYEQGKLTEAILCETRPRLQGLKLNAWELLQDGIPFRVIVDSAAGFFMKNNSVALIVAGADRIARNGDTANKIGTYSLAVNANKHKVDFVIAAPSSTIDSHCHNGSEIPIEERPPEEILNIGAPQNCKVWNPAFDVTPAELISAILTEQAIYHFPYQFESLYSRSQL